MGDGVKMKKLRVYMKKEIIAGGGGGGSGIVGVPPPPPHVFLNGIARSKFRKIFGGRILF